MRTPPTITSVLLDSLLGPDKSWDHVCEFIRFETARDAAAALNTIHSEIDRRIALERIGDLMHAKAGTPAAAELNRLTDMVLAHDKEQERQEEITELQKEIAALRSSFSRVLRIVGDLIEVVAERTSP